MPQLAGLHFDLQQTSDQRKLSFLPPLDYLTSLPHHLPGQRQELAITIAQALPTGFRLGLRCAADLQQAKLHRPPMIHDIQCAALALGGDTLQAAAEHANPVAQKRAVGWIVYVAFNGSRVRPQFLTLDHALLASE